MAVDCDEWRARLTRAEAAIERATLGESVVMQKHADKQLQFQPVDMNALEKWRAECQREVDKCNGITPTSGRGVVYVTPCDGD